MSSDNLAASQAGLELQTPTLKVINSKGEWETVIEDMGFPAGLPKYMTVDLTGKFLTDDYRIKITTNMPIYWDQILVSTFSDRGPITVTSLYPFRAELRWRGYPEVMLPDGRYPPVYNHHRLTGPAIWENLAGYYTRYGDVTPLLKESDDKYVIMSHGDEVAIDFDATLVPALPEGWSRDFFFYADGFNKDTDPNSAYSLTVQPLPFHEMSGYPYPEDECYPFDPEHMKYMEDYNTRLIRSEWAAMVR
ncbi:MAG TPA: hypothetical protein EYP53_07725 [Candidatus Latescibacteria bacterium]|nr:hypothetical protein [Candidatus Latescibacterota bacterium]